jgi:hypothetical protein
MLAFFADIFAGRNLSPLPSAADYAAKREARLAATNSASIKTEPDFKG